MKSKIYEASFFRGERLQQLDQVLNRESDAELELFALASEIAQEASKAMSKSVSTFQPSLEIPLFFLRALRQRFQQLETISAGLVELRDVERSEPAIFDVWRRVFQDASARLAASGDPMQNQIIAERLSTAYAAMLIDDESWSKTQTFKFLPQLAKQFETVVETHPKPPGRSPSRIQAFLPHVAICCTLAIILTIIFQLRPREVPAERMELAFIGPPQGHPAGGPQKLGPADDTVIRDGYVYSQPKIAELLSSPPQSRSAAIFRIGLEGVTLVAARDGAELFFPAEFWEAPIVLPGSGYETFILVNLNAPLNVLGSPPTLSPKADLDQFPGQVDEPALRHSVSKVFTAAQRRAIVRLRFARAWHEQ